MTTRLRRAPRTAARYVTCASSWQCSLCGRWFTSDTPSQVCPNCS